MLMFGLTSAFAGAEQSIYSYDYSETNALVPGFWGSEVGTCQVVDGALVITNDTERTNNYDVQKFIANGFNTQEGYTYKIIVTMMADGKGSCNLATGAWGGSNMDGGFDFVASDAYADYAVTYSSPEDVSASGAHVLWQSGKFVGTIKIKKVEVIEIAPDQPIQEPDWTDILNGEGVYAKLYPSNVPEAATSVDGEYVFESPAQVSNPWDSQFWIVLPTYLAPGTKFRVSFDYKASEATSVDSQAHEQPGNYLGNGVGNVNFTTEWKEFSAKATVSNEYNGDARPNSSYTNSFGSIAFNLSKSSAITYYIKNVKFEVDDEVAAPIINEAVYKSLSAEIAEIEATYSTVYSEFTALAMINGSGWAASFGGKLSGIQSGINAMKGTLGSLYAQGELTAESTLASIYPQYETIVGDLSALKAQFEQAITAQINGILYDLTMVTTSQMGSAIGNLQGKLQEYGVAEQYEERVNALLAKKAEAAAKLEECQAAIAGTTDLVERLTIAKNAKTEIYAILDEINAEIEAILTEAKELEEVKKAINEAVYQRLSAEIAEIEATYNTVYSEFMALAMTNGSGWAASFGGKLGGIQSGINAMKGTLGGLYAQGLLTEESTLENIYPQYTTIMEDLNSLKVQFETSITAQINSILYDLSMVTTAQMGSAIGNLQSQLNEAGVAEQYQDRVNALLAKKAEAAAKLEECQAAIAGTTDYVERLTAAKNAKTEIYAILDEINAEIEAILAEVSQTVGISSVACADLFAKGQVYDMNGRRVTVPTKGLFIINGKKVVIK